MAAKKELQVALVTNVQGNGLLDFDKRLKILRLSIGVRTILMTYQREKLPSALDEVTSLTPITPNTIAWDLRHGTPASIKRRGSC